MSIWSFSMEVSMRELQNLFHFTESQLIPKYKLLRSFLINFKFRVAIFEACQEDCNIMISFYLSYAYLGTQITECES